MTSVVMNKQIMSSAALREQFLQFFAARAHARVPSSSLIPAQDPTLLFTNAGMVPFKDVFLGRETRPYHRAASCQRCVRAGGKHNDLENVGYTARHHTFFEMLGNFSFGDYFKREAIQYAWEFLTQTLSLPPERLWVTVYAEDTEAAAIWLDELKVDPARFSRIGDKPGKKRYESDNFWAMGDTGPCGPCSEIFYDHGAAIPGGPPGSPEEDGDRYIEIWNLVFMQYNRDTDGVLHPLPKPSVDTGMGLERLAAVVQGVHSNYETDSFQVLLRAAAVLADIPADTALAHSSLRVLADHIRACSFLLVDGVLPSNEGRGYVLRRIIRRAVRHGHKLGLQPPFFHRLVAPLVAEMGAAYPELRAAQAQIEQILRGEEERFAETLEHGMKLLEQAIAAAPDATLAGKVIFKLYDRHGFPADLTADIARERNIRLDWDGFEAAMQVQRERARAASHFDTSFNAIGDLSGSTEFLGYTETTAIAQIIALYAGGQRVMQLTAGQTGQVLLDRTPFYAESGGQAGDVGLIEAAGIEFTVQDTQKQGAHHLHIGLVQAGVLTMGSTVTAQIDTQRRQATRLNHSATHLLHAALRQVLGTHVTQKGSLVAHDRLRFDFTNFTPVTAAQLTEIETLVNAQIRANAEAETRQMPIQEALASGAMALFGEKYGDSVRVLRLGAFSTELCGGTHVSRVGDIGLCKIIAESGVAAGIRRIEAVTGACALAWVTDNEQRLARLSGLVKVSRDELESRVEQLLTRSRQVEKELEQLQAKLAAQQGDLLLAKAIEINGLRVLAVEVSGVDTKALLPLMDQFKAKLRTAAIVLACVQDGRVSLVAGVTKAESSKLKAGELVNFVAQQIGGKGGGRPDLAQAGGNQPEHLAQALTTVPDWVRGKWPVATPV